MATLLPPPQSARPASPAQQPQVRAAYSSGNPALGVGAGNTPAVIDETADIQMAVSSILVSKVGWMDGCAAHGLAWWRDGQRADGGALHSGLQGKSFTVSLVASSASMLATDTPWHPLGCLVLPAASDPRLPFCAADH